MRQPVTPADATVGLRSRMGSPQMSTQLERTDRALLDDALSFVRSASVDATLAVVVPGLTGTQRAEVAAHTVLAHVAALVFPASTEGLLAELRALGMVVGEPLPSVVVRGRLARRYGLDADALDVAIVHVRDAAHDADSPMVELFALPMPTGGGLSRIATHERSECNESHIALQLDTTDGVIVARLGALLIERGGLLPDGGGYNSFENCTALYFRTSHTDIPKPYRRIELRVSGKVCRRWRQDSGNIVKVPVNVPAATPGHTPSENVSVVLSTNL
ncbi:hypothetical protein [Nocardia sp. CC227C]|uniref:hypothetical protein n=1 Tax=Nocardia sp. CC227C TaxID=3044562 RepID=UPI00278BEE31|nr:hypothetical protein [Nocardia sp. CC227C]